MTSVEFARQRLSQASDDDIAILASDRGIMREPVIGPVLHEQISMRARDNPYFTTLPVPAGSPPPEMQTLPVRPGDTAPQYLELKRAPAGAVGDLTTPGAGRLSGPPQMIGPRQLRLSPDGRFGAFVDADEGLAADHLRRMGSVNPDKFHEDKELIFGSAGDTTLLGGAETDLLMGGGGTDLLVGGSGVDAIPTTGPGRGPDIGGGLPAPTSPRDFYGNATQDPHLGAFGTGHTSGEGAFTPPRSGVVGNDTLLDEGEGDAVVPFGPDVNTPIEGGDSGFNWSDFLLGAGSRMVAAASQPGADTLGSIGAGLTGGYEYAQEAEDARSQRAERRATRRREQEQREASLEVVNNWFAAVDPETGMSRAEMQPGLYRAALANPAEFAKEIFGQHFL